MQAADLMGKNLYRDITPAEHDVRMMPLLFRQLANSIDKSQRLREIGCFKAAHDAFGRIGKLPIRYLRHQCLRLLMRHRRGAGLAGNTGFSDQSHASSLPSSHGDQVSRSAIFAARSEEHTSELQSRGHLVCRLLLEKKNIIIS